MKDIFEHTCAYARWAHMHRFLSVCHLTKIHLTKIHLTKFQFIQHFIACLSLDQKSLDHNSEINMVKVIA